MKKNIVIAIIATVAMHSCDSCNKPTSGEKYKEANEKARREHEKRCDDLKAQLAKNSANFEKIAQDGKKGMEDLHKKQDQEWEAFDKASRARMKEAFEEFDRAFKESLNNAAEGVKEEWKKASEEFWKAYNSMPSSNGTMSFWERAEIKKYCQELSLEALPSISQKLVQAACKKLLFKWHPDRWSSKPQEKQKEAEEKTKNITQARDNLIKAMEEEKLQ